MRAILARNDDAVSPAFLQSRFWADFKASADWSYSRYEARLDDDAGPVGSVGPFALSVLERGLGAGLRFAYVPHGPAVDLPPASQGAALSALAEALRPLVPPSCAFIRFDPAWYEVEAAESIAGGAPAGDVPDGGLADGGSPDGVSSDGQREPGRPSYERPLVKASDVQPPDSVVLDLSGTEDDLLAGMKPKWRYNVRLAEKKGVTVAPEGLPALGDFYSLYESTAARDRIGIHPRSYYERLLGMEAANGAEAKPDLRLWVARHGGRPLAAIITVFYGGDATYLYGASGDELRNLMPAYALQWAAIRAAREAGCASYDFYGIPPVDDPGHPMSGLYRFKTGFGGEIRHYPGTWDCVLRPAAYTAFRAAERVRLYWHKTVMKRLGR